MFNTVYLNGDKISVSSLGKPDRNETNLHFWELRMLKGIIYMIYIHLFL